MGTGVALEGGVGEGEAAGAAAIEQPRIHAPASAAATAGWRRYTRL
jgi:hypothetical protein